MTRQKRVITMQGVKPVCSYQHQFENLWLFGAFSPINGDSCLLEMPGCDTDNFQAFLTEFSTQKPEELKTLILDNGAFHHAKRLNIPDNIELLFLPPYSPELNPAERIWRITKDEVAMNTYKDLNELSQHLTDYINLNLTEQKIKSVCKSNLYSDAFLPVFKL
jgi:transposase